MAESTGKNVYVFVYGTLKQGYGNNARCMKGATFIGGAVSKTADFALSAPHVIPYLFKVREGGAKIAGEIFECPPDVLARCDILEGHPHAYCREEQQFYVTGQPPAGLGKKLVSAWVYVMHASRVQGTLVEPVDGVLTYDPAGRFKMGYMADDVDYFEDDDGQDDSDIAGDEVTVVLEDGDFERRVKLGQRRNGDLTITIDTWEQSSTESLSQGQFEEMVKKARAFMGWETPQD